MSLHIVDLIIIAGNMPSVLHFHSPGGSITRCVQLIVSLL